MRKEILKEEELIKDIDEILWGNMEPRFNDDEKGRGNYNVWSESFFFLEPDERHKEKNHIGCWMDLKKIKKRIFDKFRERIPLYIHA